jgi:hypothetical protein
MNKNILFLLCITTISSAMDDRKKLYLVAGSTRNNEKKSCFPTTQLWQEQKADVSYANTYGGKATIIDPDKNNLPHNEKHIIGDARFCDFGLYAIKTAYLEQPPSYDNYLAACIKNVSKYMTKNAVMEIEWQPYVQIISAPNSDNTQSIFNQKNRDENPFSASLDLNLACVSFAMACKTSSSTNSSLPKQFLECAITLSKTIEKLLIFYEQKNVGKKDLLVNRIHEELWLWKQLTQNGDMALLSHGPSASLEEFSQAMKTFLFTTKNPLLIGKKSEKLIDEKHFSGTFYDADLFLRNALFGFILCDAVSIHNEPYVKSFMKENGFKSVKIKRTTSKRNGRENVWIIKGVKR